MLLGKIGAPYASPDKRLTLQPVELEISDPNKAEKMMAVLLL